MFYNIENLYKIYLYNLYNISCMVLDDDSNVEKSDTLKRKVVEEKRQREHILQLNQILAKQVMEKSKMVAGTLITYHITWFPHDFNRRAMAACLFHLAFKKWWSVFFTLFNQCNRCKVFILFISHCLQNRFVKCFNVHSMVRTIYTILSQSHIFLKNAGAHVLLKLHRFMIF